ncbi:glycosyltransferase family 2 protein [Salinadaptatus halalkaliphilus]|uniref:Glycosyltransferase family 2 protein n=1 Tax=Salinadaptatus halalkaliphilus TaxID=2419781 RepID=A0A4S3TLS2_9EURY|nr:glycosyltransferase family 2 protein [Salinadaptatus halalkaliphilus]THE65141.1 glycosyltransferase family 2 protein [Salinadaptatus halalkaliphilus]
MYREHSIGVVVPAYNEAGFIGDVIQAMPAYVDAIYVIDDCSTDSTWDEIQEAARADAAQQVDPPLEYETMADDEAQLLSDGGTSRLDERATVHEPIGRVTPLRHHENIGAGGAIKTGYLATLEDGIDVTVTVDGDGQMDLAQMSRLLDPIVEGDADYAKGNRLLYREYRKAMPTFRFVGNTALTFLTKIASGYWKTMDPQNGYTAISKRALTAVDVGSLYEYYGYCNDLLVKLNASNMRVADVAMPAVYGEEESSITYTTYIRKVSWMLFRNFWWRLQSKYLVRDFHPLVLFYLLGIGTVCLGVATATWSVYSSVVYDWQLFTPIAISGLFVLAGTWSVLTAMEADMKANEPNEMQVFE